MSFRTASQLRKKRTTRYNVSAVDGWLCSALGLFSVQCIGEYHSALGVVQCIKEIFINAYERYHDLCAGYHDLCAGCHECTGDIQSIGDIMSALEVFSALGDINSALGRYQY